jgi:hypothetical protein
MAGVAHDGSGRPWRVGIWKDNGQLNYAVGDADFAAVDKTQGGAKAGPTISYNAAHDRMEVCYINADGVMCSYATSVSPIKWGWQKIGGHFQA